MESLHYGEMLGGYYINSGFYWGSTTRIYCAILEGEGSRWMGMRSRAPPVADAARRSTRSGRKNRASEQREDFFGHRKAVGQMRLRLPWERICAQYGFRFFIQEKSKFVSSTASDRKGLVKGESVPLDRVLPTFARTKVGPRREGVLTTPLQKAPRRRQAITN